MNIEEFQARLNSVFERANSDRGKTHIQGGLHEVCADLSAPYTRLFVKKIPTSILEIGVRNGHNLIVWLNVFKKIKLVGIDIVDHMPNKRMIGIDENTHPKSLSHYWTFIQGNALDRKFARNISHFDMITQNCDYDKHSPHEIIKIFENFFQKSDHHYVIESIKGERVANFVYEHIKQKHPNIIIEIYKTPYHFFHSFNSEKGEGIKEYLYAIFITK